jgi:prepilin signal peptidase PulO-like enzyme (type II secretory pathway)
MSLRRMRSGELLALAGAICLIVALALPWYENAQGKLSAWATFGAAVVLLMLAAAGGLLLALATVTERTTAIPVAAAVWGTLFGILGAAAAVVRLLERPEHATMLCAGAWLALVGALAVLIGSWQSMRDERTGMYPPDATEPRAAPH